MSSLRILFALGLAAIPAFLAGVAFDLYWLRVLSKPLPVLVLAAWVVARGAPPYGRWITVGMLFSALGDVLLDVSEATFLHGVGAFLLAHVAYVVAFVGADRRPALVRALPFAAWGVFVVAYLRGGLSAHGMLVPVAVYTTVICTMLWRAAARVGGGETSARRGARIAFGGALLFAASDSLIAFDRFGDLDIPGVRYAIILLYWLGQWGIARSACGNAGGLRH